MDLHLKPFWLDLRIYKFENSDPHPDLGVLKGAESIPTNFFECLVNRAVVPDDGPVQVGNGGNVPHADVVGVQQGERLHRKASANKYK